MAAVVLAVLITVVMAGCTSMGDVGGAYAPLRVATAGYRVPHEFTDVETRQLGEPGCVGFACKPPMLEVTYKTNVDEQAACDILKASLSSWEGLTIKSWRDRDVNTRPDGRSETVDCFADASLGSVGVSGNVTNSDVVPLRGVAPHTALPILAFVQH